MDKYQLNKIYYNAIVGIIISAILFIFINGISKMIGPLSGFDQTIYLDLIYVPGYLFRTGMRFLLAMGISVIVAILYATIAAKNIRIRKLLIPLLDVFQSIPVLGYLSFTVTMFLHLVPNNILGIELAVIFAIFTSQVWNMIFSVYQSLISVPNDLYEVAKIYRLNKWQIFWQIELPFATPGLVWNIILSIASGCFFIVASEVVSIGNANYIMPGIGSYIALALKNMDIKAVIHALSAILFLIVLFNELFFKPLISWSYKFRYEFNIGKDTKSDSWFLEYLRRAEIWNIITYPFKKVFSYFTNIELPIIFTRNIKLIARIVEIIWWLGIALLTLAIYYKLHEFCSNHLTLSDLKETIILGSITGLRVLVLLMLVSIIWVPVGIYIGLNPKLSNKVQPVIQLLTAIPANLYYPIFVVAIVNFNLNHDIWLSVLMIVGSQWYIVYNIIAGAQTIPTDLLEAGSIFKLNSIQKALKITIPAVLPYYVTGLVTAAGGAWNASIIAEVVSWGNTILTAHGLGAYIVTNTDQGNFAHITLGLIVMSSFVIIIDHLIWKPLYKFTSTRFRLE